MRRIIAGSAKFFLLSVSSAGLPRRKMFIHPLLDPRRSYPATLSTETSGTANVLTLTMTFSDDL
jgi:hypothetical protein